MRPLAINEARAGPKLVGFPDAYSVLLYGPIFSYNSDRINRHTIGEGFVDLTSAAGSLGARESRQDVRQLAR
jgi:hypothetical protein